MAHEEKRLKRRFDELERHRKESARANSVVRNRLLGPLRRDPDWASYIRERRDAARSVSSKRVAPPGDRVAGIPVILGSLIRTFTPPFDHVWTSKQTHGSPTASASATANGDLAVRVVTGDNEASATASSRVGISFASPLDGANNFRFWASPAFSFNWHEYVTASSAHSDGSIGLYAQRYDWAGNFDGTVLDYTVPLWKDDTWWDDGGGFDYVSAFPLSAGFQIDSDHWYVLWVGCQTHDSGDGFGTFSGSSVHASLNVRVPSIGWEVG